MSTRRSLVLAILMLGVGAAVPAAADWRRIDRPNFIVIGDVSAPVRHVNMFETVFNEITWDIHGSAPFSPISCYRDLVGPMFDHAYNSLLEDLHDRRLLQDTLVLAAGEFGRTPKVNPAGGRDHWTNCWTM